MEKILLATVHVRSFGTIVENVQELFDLEMELIEKRREEFANSVGSREIGGFDILNFHRVEEIEQYLYDLEGEKRIQ